MDNLLFIKANLPATEEDYKSGYGEGCFFIVDQETKKAYDNDTKGGLYFGTLDNDSVYWPTLKHGTVCPLEMRGENRPVVPYQWLKDNYSIIDGVFYEFDCLDGDLSDQLFNLDDLKKFMGLSEDYELTEREIIRLASNYEAELYKYTYEQGTQTEGECIYSPYDFFD